MVATILSKMDLDTAVAVLKQELKDHPEKLELERDVLEKYGRLFRYENIDNITAEEFSDFLDFKNNNHWTISRHKTNLTKDMDKLKKSLKILLDESIPIANRLKRLRDEKNPDYQKYLGEAYFSPILLVSHPDKYPVYNGTVKIALDKMHVAKLTPSVIWERYPEVQKIILNIAQKHNLSLWEMDWVWWKALGAKSYEELLKYIRDEMVMQENYQPIVLQKILLSGSASREEIEAELKKNNPDSESQSMTNTVLKVLQDEKHPIIRKEDDLYVINSFDELSSEKTRELVNWCNKRLEKFGAVKSNYWVWSVTHENWEIVKQKNIWASKIGQKIRDKIVSGDKVIFYVLGTGQFKGIFEFDGKWYDATKPVWTDESNSVIYISQIHLIPLVFGDVIVYDIASELSIFENPDDKRLVNLVLKGAGGYPSNNGKPIPIDDYRKIYQKMESYINYWKISPGAEADLWDEQRTNKVTAIGWNDLGNLQNQSFEQIHLKLRELWPSQIAVNAPQFRDFLSIKKGDIIIANKGFGKIVGIGRVVGDYQYRPDLTFYHTYPVEWFDVQEKEIPSQGMTWMKTVYAVTPEQYQSFISPKEEHVYYLTPADFEKFLIAIPKLEAFNQPGQKPPMSAKQFQLLFRILYGSALKIFDALDIRVKDLDLDNRIIRISDSTSKFPYATILPTDVSYLKEYVSTLQKDDKLFDVHRATLWNYAKQIGNLAGLKIFRGKEERETEGMDLLIFRESRAMQMSLDGARDGLIRRKLRVDFSNAVLRYDQPTIEDLKEWELQNSKKSPDIIPPIETYDDEQLSIPTTEEMKAGFAKISEELLVPEEKIAEIVTSLAGGRHVLLAGPIGTGKTRLAKIIPEIFWDNIGGYYSEDYTATADWNTQDVIGGIFPKMDNGTPTYDIQNGCVVETVSKNWSNGVNGGRRVPTVNSSKSSPYAGTWLTIDEFNRADIDKAFGQLFTSLRTRSLKIPTDEKGKSFKELPIPKDFRIIGTLNTADKHFLFQLSDALKSRFAYIEIDIPSRKDEEKEIYYAMKNALDELDSQDFSSLVTLDHINKKIDIEKSNPEFYQNVLYAYNFLDIVRVFKKLGTAILKLIYQNLLVGTKMNGNSKIVLDNALSSNLVSQLENLSVAEIGAIRALNSNRVVEYFQRANTNPNKQSYVESLRKTLEYLVISNKENLVSSFSKGNIKGNESDEWNLIKTAYDKKKPELQLDLSKMKQSMDDLMKTLVI